MLAIRPCSSGEASGAELNAHEATNATSANIEIAAGRTALVPPNLPDQRLIPIKSIRLNRGELHVLQLLAGNRRERRSSQLIQESLFRSGQQA